MFDSKIAEAAKAAASGAHNVINNGADPMRDARIETAARKDFNAKPQTDGLEQGPEEDLMAVIKASKVIAKDSKYQSLEAQQANAIAHGASPQVIASLDKNRTERATTMLEQLNVDVSTKEHIQSTLKIATEDAAKTQQPVKAESRGR